MLNTGEPRNRFQFQHLVQNLEDEAEEEGGEEGREEDFFATIHVAE